jgi:hypothetical protein
MALSPSAAANRRFGFQFKPEITPPPIPTNPGTAPISERDGDELKRLDVFAQHHQTDSERRRQEKADGSP